MDETSIQSIEADGTQSRPDDPVYEKALRSGQFTSPVCVELDWVTLTGFVANDERGVRVLVIEERDDQDDTFHEIVHPGRKIEGPGLFMWVRGENLRYVVTEHENVTTSPRINAVYRGQFAGLAAPWAHPGFVDVPPDHRFYKHIMAGARRGVISGYTDGTFKPDNNITRGQLMKVLALALGWEE